MDIVIHGDNWIRVVPEFPEYSRIHADYSANSYTNTPDNLTLRISSIELPEYAFFKNIKPKFMTF